MDPRAMRAARVGAAFAAAVVLAGLGVPGCSGGGGGANRPESLRGPQAGLALTVDPGAPVLAPAAGFVGSEKCIGCHGGTYLGYSQTAHARGLRTAGRPGVSGKPVAAQADFKDGLDLASTPAFAAYGAAAPRLRFEDGAERPWSVVIGGGTYAVEQVYGGSLREDYLVRLGQSFYRLPMEYDPAAKSWAPVDADTWYAGNAARFASGAAAAAGIDRAASADRRCIGCHVSGLAASYDGGTGEWTTGYTELGIGCESCHGPGFQHVASEGNPALILNPRKFVDGSEAGSRMADDTCGRCHTRGTGGTLAGAPSPLLFPWSTVLDRPFLPGDEARNFVTPSADAGDYWGYKDNYLGSVPTPGDSSDDTFVAAKRGWNQASEHASGVHAPRNGPGPTATEPLKTGRCFDCHAVHGSREPSQIREEWPGAPGVPLSAEDGSLCLSCHAGRAGDPFEALSPLDVTAYAKDRPSAVPQAVVDHMKDGGMPVQREDFKPRKTGVGRCTTCHMASTNTDPRGATTDPEGFTAGGPRGGSHTGLVSWPSVSANYGMTNSCNACHPKGVGDEVDDALEQWASGDPDGDGRFHGFTPRGIMLGNLNVASGNGLRCAQCHTTPGYRGITVAGDVAGLSTDDAALASIVNRSARMDAGITCAACHGKQADGTFAAGNNPLRLPKDELCASCHFGAGITFADYTSLGTAVHFPQSDLVHGGGGAEPPATGPYTNAGHTGFSGSCVKCHFDTETPGVTPSHSFQPQVGTCAVCHPGASTLNFPAAGNYDGQGGVQGIRTELEGLLAILKAAILSKDALVAFDGEGFRRSGVPGLPGATAALQRAAFNWETVHRDGSGGAHNYPRAVRLLQQSYREVMGADVPGAALR